jgi:hypothetical protein
VVIGNVLGDYVRIPFFSHGYSRPAIVAAPVNICPRQHDFVSRDENTRNKSTRVSLFNKVDTPGSSLDSLVPELYVTRKNKVQQRLRHLGCTIDLPP